MNEKEAREFREACRVLAEGWQSWTAPFRDILPREDENGRLDFDTAWECARVEYVWRQKREAARKGREQWQGLYKVAIANSRARHQDWEREKGLRLTAEGDRDEYKARCEERGRHILELELSAALSRLQGGEPTSGRTRDDHGGDLLRERNDAIACAETLRKDLEKARRGLSAFHTVRDATMKRNGELAAKVASLREGLEKARRDLENMREDNVRLTTHAESLREALKGAHARADRIKEANLRLCALREADRTGKNADEVLTGLRTCGLLITRRKGSEVRDVSRCGEGRNIGYMSPFASGWNAYMYQSDGPVKFVGWYDDADKGADVIDRRYGRWT